VDVKLTTLEQLIERCWNSAEVETAKAVVQKHPSPSEEQLTFLFSGELRRAIGDASSARRIETAFLADLRRSIPRLDLGVARRAGGLVARVNLHGRWHEGNVSAADLGIVITRPLVRLSPGRINVEFRRDHPTGLLAQAKLGRAVGPTEGGHAWGRLTQSQAGLFPKRRGYYSLLLYRLNGQNSDELEPFAWQLCRNYTVRQVKKWLRSDAFPGEISSSEVLRRLFARMIGTEDPKVIQTIIDPTGAGAHSIELQIFWPDGSGPPPSFPLCELQHKRQEVHH